jgi:hypothetical protein
MVASAGFGVRQLAAAFLQASLLAEVPPYVEMTARKLAGDKAAASCRTPKPGLKKTKRPTRVWSRSSSPFQTREAARFLKSP